jgi:predicted nucleic acid-binding protein
LRDGLRQVFVDTSAFFSISVSSDTHHSDALRLMADLRPRRTRAYTSNAIIAETHVLLLSRLRKARSAREARSRAREIIQGIYASNIEIVRPTETDEYDALRLLAKFDDQDFSFTDATSFAVMRRLGIDVAFTFDDDFTRAGFTDLRHV